jgi:hypothetical protein
LAEYVGPSKDIIERVILFLDKPHITLLERLVGYRKKITVGRLNEVHEIVDKQNFDIVIWNFKVENKHHKIARVAKDCSVKIDWDFIREDGQLLWRVRQDEPDERNLNVTPSKIPRFENRYDKVLGDDYTNKLIAMGQTLQTIPQGKSREIYFLLTIKDQNVAYPIMEISRGSNYGSKNEKGIVIQNIHGIPLFIKFDRVYSFGIRFECHGYSEERDHQYSLRINDHDDIVIHEV